MLSLTCIAITAILDYWRLLASRRERIVRSLTKKTPAPSRPKKQVCSMCNSLIFFQDEFQNIYQYTNTYEKE